MYALHDLEKNSVTELMTAWALVNYIYRLFPHYSARFGEYHWEQDFLSKYNVTGKDIAVGNDMWMPWEVHRNYEHNLRRFLIVDAQGRHIAKDDAIELLKTEPYRLLEKNRNLPEFRREPVAKCHSNRYHRKKGPTLYIRDQLAATDHECKAEVELLCGSAEKNRLFTASPGFEYENALKFAGKQKSWKNTKCGRQWGRHKKSGSQSENLCNLIQDEMHLEEEIGTLYATILEQFAKEGDDETA